MAEHPLVEALRARHEPHRPVSERVQAHIRGLQEQRRHRKKETVGAAIAGAPLGGAALGGPALRRYFDNYLRQGFVEMQGQMTPNDMTILEDVGLLPKRVLQEQKAQRRLADILAGHEANPLVREELKQIVGRAANPRNVARSLDLSRSPRVISAAAQYALEQEGRALASPALQKWIGRAGVAHAARYIPHVAGAGLGAYLINRKYRDLKRSPEELADRLRNRDVRRYALTDAIQNVMLPSMAIPRASEGAIQSGLNLVNIAKGR